MLDKVLVRETSSASGTTKAGIEYAVTVLDDLQYQRVCPIAVSGSKKYIIHGQHEFVLDYGRGDCDKTLTVSGNGKTKTIIL
jgi:hypothetical protein